MPKHRKRRRSTSSEKSESSVYKLLKKIDKRLTAVERKQSKRFRYVGSETGSDSSSSWVGSRSRESPMRNRNASNSETEESRAPVADQQNFTNVEVNANDNAEQQNGAGNNEVIAQPVLQEEILSILGSGEETKKLFTDPIQAEIAARWSHILASGLDEAVQKTLLEKYLPPENCPLLKPPSINPEVKVAISDSIIRRDDRLIALQRQVAASMSAIGLVLTSLLSVTNVDKNHVQQLSDAGRLLANIHYLESVSRRELIALNLNKELKATLTDTPIGDLLFGMDLDSRIRAVKDLEKSGQQLRPKNKISKPMVQASGFKGQSGNSKNLLSQRYGVRKGGQINRTPQRAPRRKTQEVLRKRTERYRQNNQQRRHY